MQKSRIHWIDVTKGVLILLMVFGHVANIAGRQGIDDSFLIKCMFFTSLYTCFFMQAFIILSGYTSNFEKPLKDFFISQVKTVFIPWMVFCTLCHLYRMLVYGSDIFYVINGQKYFFLIEDFWFLQVLFFGKIIYWFLHKYINSDIIRAGVLLCMMFVGFSIFAMHDNVEETYHYSNYLHYKDLLCMVFFLWFGNYCRRKDVFKYLEGKYLLVLLTLYLFGHILRFIFRMKGLNELLIAPVVLSHGGNAINPLQIPAYLYYVILGSFSCFGIMKFINSNRFLEYFGKNSLVVYCVHFIFLDISIRLMYMLLPPNSVLSALAFIICTISLTLLGSTVFIYLTKFKPFNYLIGKF